MSPPLRSGTLRAHLHRLAGGRELREGKTVVLSRELIASHFPGGQAQHPSLPVSYDAEAYVLTGGDDLRPVE